MNIMDIDSDVRVPVVHQLTIATEELTALRALIQTTATVRTVAVTDLTLRNAIKSALAETTVDLPQTAARTATVLT